MNDLLIVLITMATLINCLASIYITITDRANLSTMNKLVCICSGYSLFVIILTIALWEY